MGKIFTNIKTIFKKLKKSKKFYYFLGLFVVIILSLVIYISYGNYYDDDSSGTIFNGTAFINSPDITLYIYRETRAEDGTGTGDFERIYFIPKLDYTYDSSLNECTNGVTNIRLVNNKFAISTTKRATCKVYFTADDVDFQVSEGETVSPNVIFRIYVEQTLAEGDFVQVGKIPNNGQSYLLNVENTLEHSPNCCADNQCSNISIDNTKRQVSIVTDSDINCNIYLDLES